GGVGLIVATSNERRGVWGDAKLAGVGNNNRAITMDRVLLLISILRRLLHAVDHKHFNWTFSRFQPEAKLLLNGGKDRGTGCIWRWRVWTTRCDWPLYLFGSPLELYIVATF